MNQTPRKIDVAITGRCNLACKYCFYADEMVGRHDLPSGRWMSFFEELGRLKVMEVCLTGGEVFTRPDLFELIDAIIDNRMRYQMLSNGTLITENTLARFEKGKRRLRLNSIQISIDGSRPEIHDKSRPGSFDRAVRALRLLGEAGFPVAVRVTVNRYNVDDLEDIARLLLDDIGLPSFSTNDACLCGASDRAEGGIMLSFEQKQSVMRKLADLERRYDGRINAMAGSLATVKELEKIERLRSEGSTGIPGRGKLTSCGGAFSQLAVLHDGTIVPCHQLSGLRLGEVGVDDLGKIWSDHPLLKQLRERNKISLRSLETCKQCEYIGFCGGGCPAGAYYLTGKLDVRNPMDCFRVIKGEDPRTRLEDAVNTCNCS